jgi:hypothetical protein
MAFSVDSSKWPMCTPLSPECYYHPYSAVFKIVFLNTLAVPQDNTKAYVLLVCDCITLSKSGDIVCFGTSLLNEGRINCKFLGIPYVCVYKPHFFTIIYPPKLECGLYKELKKLEPPRKSRYNIDN